MNCIPFSGTDDLHLETTDLCHEQPGATTSTLCVLRGSDIIIYCAVPDSSVGWISSQFGTELLSLHNTKDQLGPDIQLKFVGVVESSVFTSDICVNASATVNNVKKSLDGLNLTCSNVSPQETVSYKFTIRVIGKKNSLVFLVTKTMNSLILLIREAVIGKSPTRDATKTR